MTFSVSFVDFWQGHDPTNNILVNCLRHYVDNNLLVVDNPDFADIVFVTIYGNSHTDFIKKNRHKCILWLGENKRPNLYNCPYSISFDYHSYSNSNFSCKNNTRNSLMKQRVKVRYFSPRGQ